MRSRQASEVPALQMDSDSDDWELDATESNSYRLEKLDDTTRISQDIDHRASLAGRADKPARRRSDATEHSFMLYTPDEEQSVIHKFDRRLVLFIALLYMLSFLDRSSRHSTAIQQSNFHLVDPC